MGCFRAWIGCSATAWCNLRLPCQSVAGRSGTNAFVRDITWRSFSRDRGTGLGRAEPSALPCVGQNVGKRDSAVKAALGLFQKADCDRLGNRIARGGLACVRVAGEHREGSDTSAATFRDSLEDCL